MIASRSPRAAAAKGTTGLASNARYARGLVDR